MGKRTVDSLQQKSSGQFRESRSASRVVTSPSEHLPVLADEVVEAFHWDREAWVVDGTLGLGGHSERLLATYPRMKILGLDWDAQALEAARQRLGPFSDRFEGLEGNYAELPSLWTVVNSGKWRSAAGEVLRTQPLESLVERSDDNQFWSIQLRILTMPCAEVALHPQAHAATEAADEGAEGCETDANRIGSSTWPTASGLSLLATTGTAPRRLPACRRSVPVSSAV